MIKSILALWALGLLITIPYVLSDTGPHSIACSYDRIGLSTWSMLNGGRTAEEQTRDTAANPNCKRVRYE